MKKIFLILSATLFLASCGHISNQVNSDEDLQEKAAFALNTTANKVTISDRTPTFNSIKFVATVGRKSYQCYVTTAYGMTSDAICSGAGSGKTCDALSRKAGRC